MQVAAGKVSVIMAWVVIVESLPGRAGRGRAGGGPASDELTNTKIHHGATSRCHLLLSWAHKSLALSRHPSGVPRLGLRSGRVTPVMARHRGSGPSDGTPLGFRSGRPTPVVAHNWG